MKTPPSVEEALQGIKDDNLSGATHLVQRGAGLLLDYLRDEAGEALSSGIRSLARNLVDAQPTMAPLVNVVNHLFSAIKNIENPSDIKRKGIAAVEGFLDGLIRGADKIRGHALPLVVGKRIVLTHSYSTTVVGVLTHVMGIEVICPESRPLCEGLRTAQELGEGGIRVSVMVDCAALSRIGECDLVMVGADSITPQGVVNKVGTYGFALAAHEAGIPFYVLSGREKFLPPPFCETLRIEAKDPSEVTTENIPNSTIENFYFDRTPLHLVSAVVTPEGLIPGDHIQKVIETMVLSDELMQS